MFLTNDELIIHLIIYILLLFHNDHLNLIRKKNTMNVTKMESALLSYYIISIYYM
jgi:hypothetical protein